MEGIRTFLGFGQPSDEDARAKCKKYIEEAVEYSKTVEPLPSFIPFLEEILASKIATEPAEAKSPAAEEFWSKWDEYKEDILNLNVSNPKNVGKIPEGSFVAMWRFLESGRFPANTAPPEQARRKSSIGGRVRFA